MDAANHQNKLLKNIFSLSLLQVANNLLPILSIPIIVRIIGPENFGAINFATVVVSYFILLTNYGFDLTATRAIALNKSDVVARSRVFNEVLFSKLFLLAISIGLFLIVLFTLPQLASEKEVAIFSFLIVFSFVLTPNWLYQGMQELYNIAIFNFITKLLFTVLVLVVIRQKEDYIWQPLIISVAHVIVGVVAFIWAVKRYTIHLKLVSLKKVFDVLWSERIIFFSFVSVNVYTYASALILGLVDTKEAVAFFTASWRLVIIMHTIVTIPLGMSLFPFIGESFGISREKGIEQVKKTAPFVALITSLMGITVWLLAPFIISIFYGEAFRPAIGVLRILCFVPMIMGISNLMGVQTLVNLKMDKPYTKIIAVGGVLGLAFNFWLSRYASYIGAAWAWLLTEISILLILWFFLYKKGIQIIDPKFFSYNYIAQSVAPMWQSVKQKIQRK